MRLRVPPEIGSMRLSEVARTDLSDLLDELLASGLNESTIGVTLLSLRAIYHAGIQITLDLYGHLTPGSESETAAQLDAYLDRAGGRAPTAQLTR